MMISRSTCLAFVLLYQALDGSSARPELYRKQALKPIKAAQVVRAEAGHAAIAVHEYTRFLMGATRKELEEEQEDVDADGGAPAQQSEPCWALDGDGVRFEGLHLGWPINTETFEDCHELCMLEQDCTHFAYEPSADNSTFHHCTLLASLTATVQDPKMKSGTRDCTIGVGTRGLRVGARKVPSWESGQEEASIGETLMIVPAWIGTHFRQALNAVLGALGIVTKVEPGDLLVLLFVTLMGCVVVGLFCGCMHSVYDSFFGSWDEWGDDDMMPTMAS